MTPAIRELVQELRNPRLNAYETLRHHAAAELERLAWELAQSSERTDAGWQPIETAPKDGTDIIVYRPHFDGDYIPKVGTDYWMTKGVLEPTWAKSRKDCQPTHWRHFPAPPTKVKANG